MFHNVAFQKQSAFVSDVMGRISVSTDCVQSCKSADLVVEAILENLSVKQDLFSALDASCMP